ncbi:hypothetical protein V6N11_053983 [Hibiscus sabdariffa]|uniref:Uncharacterized protein n=1 Tax=Hibiscus sabdariffa TaxID=183260 RepID=A0ABR2S311_9ROSI
MHLLAEVGPSVLPFLCLFDSLAPGPFLFYFSCSLPCFLLSVVSSACRSHRIYFSNQQASVGAPCTSWLTPSIITLIPPLLSPLVDEYYSEGQMSSAAASKSRQHRPPWESNQSCNHLQQQQSLVMVTYAEGYPSEEDS